MKIKTRCHGCGLQVQTGSIKELFGSGWECLPDRRGIHHNMCPDCAAAWVDQKPKEIFTEWTGEIMEGRGIRGESWGS